MRVPPDLQPIWLEQLLAESTGKNGESKDNTNQLLRPVKDGGTLPEDQPALP